MFDLLLVLKYGFKKAAKKNEFISIHEIGDAFRHSGQNPAEDVVKDMIDKAIKLKASYPREDEGSYSLKSVVFSLHRSELTFE